MTRPTDQETHDEAGRGDVLTMAGADLFELPPLSVERFMAAIDEVRAGKYVLDYESDWLTTESGYGMERGWINYTAMVDREHNGDESQEKLTMPRPTDTEIREELKRTLNEKGEIVYAFPAMSFVEGVDCALRWVLGEEQLRPMDP